MSNKQFPCSGRRRVSVAERILRALCVTAILLSAGMGAAVADTQALWSAIYNGPVDGPDRWTSAALSPDGTRLFITGSSRGNGDDYATVAYDALTGAELWVARYDGPDIGNNHDWARAVEVSPDGSRVFITGSSMGAMGEHQRFGYATISYDADSGDELWVARYDNPDPAMGNEAWALGVSPDGSLVFVGGTTGPSLPPRGKYGTVAYDADDGSEVWVAIYDAPGNGPGTVTDLVVSPDGGRVFVTGESRTSTLQGSADYATIAYDATTGAELWVARYDGPGGDRDVAQAIGISPDGQRLFVTGWAFDEETNCDYTTIAYDPDTGDELWVSAYNGTGDACDRAFGLSIAPDGTRVFVTGESWDWDSSNDYATVAYDAADGTELWSARYVGPVGGQDRASDIGISPDGARVFVTGGSAGAGTGEDIVTIAYDAATGSALWIDRYDGEQRADAANALVVAPDGERIFVTGHSSRADTSLNYMTLAYAPDISPGLALTPAALDFGQVRVGLSSNAQAVTLTNTGSAAVTVTAVSWPEPSFVPAESTCDAPPFTLAPIESCYLTYRFQPAERGPISDTVSVTSDAAGSPHSFTLQGEGILHRLDISPNLLAFGLVPVGEISGAMSITLSNPGDVDVVLGNMSLSGPSFTPAGSSCGETLSPGASCELEYVFAPVMSGAVSVELAIASNASPSPHIVTLQGVGGGAAIEVAPTRLEVVLEQDQAAFRNLTIANPGNVPLHWEVTEEPVPPETIVLNHSASPDIVDGNSVACSSDNGVTTGANQFLRVFELSDFGVARELELTEVRFGIEVLTVAAPISVNLYTLDGGLVYENLTPLAAVTETFEAQQQTLVDLPLVAPVAPDTTLVMELEVPDLSGVGVFSPGSNGLGESAPSYMAASLCNVHQPTTIADIGYPDVHLVMSVTGVLEAVDCILPGWASLSSSGGSVADAGEQVVEFGFDATGLEAGVHQGNLCLASNDPATPLTIVPVTLSVQEAVEDAIFSDGFEHK